MTTATTPWGPTVVLEEISLPQRAGDKRFASIVQLLETPKGERLVRFAYATDGTARRGPVTMRERDLERLRTLLEQKPVLRAALLGGEAPGESQPPSRGRRRQQ